MPLFWCLEHNFSFKKMPQLQLPTMLSLSSKKFNFALFNTVVLLLCLAGTGVHGCCCCDCCCGCCGGCCGCGGWGFGGGWGGGLGLGLGMCPPGLSVFLFFKILLCWCLRFERVMVVKSGKCNKWIKWSGLLIYKLITPMRRSPPRAIFSANLYASKPHPFLFIPGVDQLPKFTS